MPATMPASPTHYYVRTPDGAMSAFCSHEHRKSWLLVTAYHRVPGSQAKDIPGDLSPCCCETCCHCGALIAPAPAPNPLPAGAFCVLHDDSDCPTFTAMPTLCALRAVVSLTYEYGAPLPPRAFDCLESCAEVMNDAGTFPTSPTSSVASGPSVPPGLTHQSHNGLTTDDGSRRSLWSSPVRKQLDPAQPHRAGRAGPGPPLEQAGDADGSHCCWSLAPPVGAGRRSSACL
jgi:hypothetical protein